MSDVKDWATENMLKFNVNKTELVLVTSNRTKHLHSLPTLINIGNAQIPFKQSVKNFGIAIDCHPTTKITSLASCQCMKHIQNVLFVPQLPHQFCTIIYR